MCCSVKCVIAFQGDMRDYAVPVLADRFNRQLGEFKVHFISIFEFFMFANEKHIAGVSVCPYVSVLRRRTDLN